TVEFTIAATPDYPELNQAFTQMRAKITDAQGQLPPNAMSPRVFDDFGDVYAVYFAIVGEGFALSELYEYAKDLHPVQHDLRDTIDGHQLALQVLCVFIKLRQRELVTVDGVSKVVLNGVQEEVIYVEYEPARLIELGLSPGQIGQVLEGQSLVTPAGTILAGDTRLTLRPESAVDSLDAIGNLVISNPATGASFKLHDIAEISRGFKEPATSLLYRDGQPAIGLGISNTRGGNVVNMSAAVQERLAALESNRPIGIDVLTISDQGTSVKASVDDFVLNVATALAIVVGTLLVFMGLRSGILMGGILLVTVAGTLMGMYLYGLDMQRISLGALIIALGMLVDNAIVVVEGTLVRVQRGEDAAKASVAVVKQTIWPLLGGTLVGILAFSPIGFSPDNTGEYAGSLFWTIGIALLFSWLVAIWLTPYFCAVMLRPGKARDDSKENILLRLYRAFLGFAIRVRYLTVLAVIALFASAILLFSAVPPGFFPSSTRAQFVVDYTLPEGTDITKTQADVLEIAEFARGLDGVTGTNSVIGGGHLRFMLIYEAEDNNQAYGQVLVDVDDFTRIDGLRTVLQEHIDETYPDANAKVWRFVLGPGGGSKIEARFFGPDGAVLRALSEQAKQIMVDAGAIAVKDNWREQVQVIRPVVDLENARRLNLSQSEISGALYAHLEGTNLGKYREGDELRNVVMRPVESARNDAGELANIQVFSQAAGAYIPITQVVDRFELVFEPGNLRRIDRELAITAQSDNAPGTLSGDLFNAVRGPIEAIPLPPGYRMQWKGEFGNSADANEGLASTMPLGFGAMF
ncbi:MAG: efflux RND transporter permease subunit, partial [Pseudomonadota bacterium]